MLYGTKKNRLLWTRIPLAGGGIPSHKDFEVLFLKTLPQQYTIQKQNVGSASLPLADAEMLLEDRSQQLRRERGGWDRGDRVTAAAARMDKAKKRDTRKGSGSAGERSGCTGRKGVIYLVMVGTSPSRRPIAGAAGSLDTRERTARTRRRRTKPMLGFPGHQLHQQVLQPLLN